MVRKAGSETLAGDVYARLRAAIFEGRYGAGERLLPAELAVDFQVSPGVVREALTRLAAQGVAVVSPNRGFNVAHMDASDMTELVEFRVINETAALRLSIERGDVAWEGRVVAAHHQLKLLRSDDFEAWQPVHRGFHLSLLSACGNRRLLRECEELLDAADLYLRWSRQIAHEHASGSVFINRDHLAEHTAIMDATLSRDADLATALYRAHLVRTEELIEPAAAEAEAEAGSGVPPVQSIRAVSN